MNDNRTLPFNSIANHRTVLGTSFDDLHPKLRALADYSSHLVCTDGGEDQQYLKDVAAIAEEMDRLKRDVTRLDALVKAYKVRTK